jgi:hypothetical protein
VKSKKAIRGWCTHCGVLSYAAQKKESDALTCRVCGDDLKPLHKLSEEEKAMADMQEWFSKVCGDDLNGPSPIGAMEELKCSRSMIDRLVERQILEKSEFSFKDRNVVIISKRSIEKAKDNRMRTGNWTGHSVKRGA